jgi:hypothetical protein
MSESETQPTLPERELRASQTLEQSAAERAKAESETEKTFRLRREEEERVYQANRHRVTATARTDTAETKAKYQAARDRINTTADTDTKAVEAEYADARKTIVGKANGAKNSAKKKVEESRWQALAVFEAGKDGAIKQFKQHEAEVQAATDLVETLKHDATPALKRVARFAPKDAGTAPAGPDPEQPIDALREVFTLAEKQLVPVDRAFLPKLLAPQAFIWPFLALGGGLAYALGPKLGWGTAAGIGAGAAVVAAVAIYILLARLARAQVARVYPPFAASLAEADRLLVVGKQWARTTLDRTKDDVEKRRQSDVAAADARFQQTVAEIEDRRQKANQEADATYPPRIKAIADRREAELKEADEVYPRRLDEIQQRYQRDLAKLDESHAQAKAVTDLLYEEAWQALIDRWRNGLARVAADADFVNETAQRQFLEWHTADIDAWVPPAVAPDGLKFGTESLDLKDVPQGVSADNRLKPYGPTRHDLPALLPFPRRSSVLIKAADAGKTDAVMLLQTLMLRFATSLPPGKVRFTIIDPVGLGENFAAFMHMADYSEILVTSRIWTETPHIEQRLADLSSHMENVIQKYLRNEFETIEDYNTFAGEVAEPFRVLVVANFPANFSEAAARRLVSIASSGTRCGVYTLISLDTKQQLPSGVQLKDLEPHCVNFQWQNGAIRWKDGELAKLPLTYDTPPSQDRFSRLMHKVGDLARHANRVEVPFEFIAPPPDKYWTYSTAKGVDIPLGRAGATKLQHLKLGSGTSQHVLIAGKTGSGKSTLLHALIANGALRYSPDELELYLIDFKKGVEFKVYAAEELPHARVIAVESEREFGLSVLQRLDAELKDRGDRFRDLGVQDLNAYREADDGKNPLPRVLFVVDEFQEFFVEDDKIAQDVALLLDRLVRQGRAFGIHVILGSQSLGGAYSLARSTIGQMAVRVALQCSESDAHLILSEENSAARLLNRPGEAIYNDQNGMVEGNNPFQVVWLNDDRREDYLRLIRGMARERHRPPVSQIVFEGNLPAIAAKNHLLAALVEAPAFPEPPKADYAWLGEAIAIKDPTAAIFRPQSGSNLLIVGQNDLMALGIFEMAILSLAAQHDPSGVGFYLFDASPADSALSGRLAKIRDVIPHAALDVRQRDLPAVIGAIAAEVERRQKADEPDAPNLYLFIFDLSRLRDLRKSDDDFGFGGYGGAKADPPAKLFGNIMRDGPPVGVHTVVWCDSLNNLNRAFDRSSLREFETRVLFQMSGNDSSTLIDGPAASRLGPNRALYLSEEEGRLEKFRPYGLAPAEWLADFRDHLARRPAVTPLDLPRTPPPAPESSEPAESGFGSSFTSPGFDV